MNEENLDMDISGEVVRSVIKGIVQADSTTYQEGNRFQMIGRSVKKEGDLELKEGRVQLYQRLTPKFKELFPDKDRITRVFEGGVLIYSESNDHETILNIFSSTSLDAGGRYYPTLFSLNFGKDKSKAEEFIRELQKNTLFLKSAMERVFSPDGLPTSTLLPRNMDHKIELTTSPFIRLTKDTPVFVGVRNRSQK